MYQIGIDENKLVWIFISIKKCRWNAWEYEMTNGAVKCVISQPFVEVPVVNCVTTALWSNTCQTSPARYLLKHCLLASCYQSPGSLKDRPRCSPRRFSSGLSKWGTSGTVPDEEYLRDRYSQLEADPGLTKETHSHSFLFSFTIYCNFSYENDKEANRSNTQYKKKVK